MGRLVLAGTVAIAVVIIGMLVYPTVHLNWSGIDVTQWIPLTKAGGVVLSYAFIFFLLYVAITHFSKR